MGKNNSAACIDEINQVFPPWFITVSDICGCVENDDIKRFQILFC